MQTAGLVTVALFLVAQALAFGFGAGILCYAHVYQHFLKRQEELAAMKVQKAIQAQTMKALEKRNILKELKEQYGEIPEAHQDVLQDELEKVLSSGPRR